MDLKRVQMRVLLLHPLPRGNFSMAKALETPKIKSPLYLSLSLYISLSLLLSHFLLLWWCGSSATAPRQRQWPVVQARSTRRDATAIGRPGTTDSVARRQEEEGKGVPYFFRFRINVKFQILPLFLDFDHHVRSRFFLGICSWLYEGDPFLIPSKSLQFCKLTSGCKQCRRPFVLL